MPTGGSSRRATCSRGWVRLKPSRAPSELGQIGEARPNRSDLRGVAKSGWLSKSHVISLFKPVHNIKQNRTYKAVIFFRVISSTFSEVTGGHGRSW